MSDIKMSTLEQKLNELESITQRLESGELSIDDAISLYSDGMQMALECRKNLDAMKEKVAKTKQRIAKSMEGSEIQESFGSNLDDDTPF